ncbi:MAG: hypothetical protein EAZ55_11635 [Cytophagales bacterium]|nr:MAG: hypothetical protein EAZ55_11635 [Cytophagales bacterium]
MELSNKFYEDNYVFIAEDLEKSFIYFFYKIAPENMPPMRDEDFQKSMTAYGKRVLEYRAPMTMSLTRMAFVLSPDIFAQVSLQQMMEEEGISDKYSKPQYFDKEEDALQWLFG